MAGGLGGLGWFSGGGEWGREGPEGGRAQMAVTRSTPPGHQ